MWCWRLPVCTQSVPGSKEPPPPCTVPSVGCCGCLSPPVSQKLLLWQLVLSWLPLAIVSGGQGKARIVQPRGRLLSLRSHVPNCGFGLQFQFPLSSWALVSADRTIQQLCAVRRVQPLWHPEPALAARGSPEEWPWVSRGNQITSRFGPCLVACPEQLQYRQEDWG